MSNQSCADPSSVVTKLLTGITGLALVSFLIVHLAGNLTIYGGPAMFNEYAHFLHSFGHGAFIWFARASLLAFFVVHILLGVKIYRNRAKTRPTPYAVDAYAGGKSRKSIHSLWMIASGGVLFLFVIVHILHFKGGEVEYVTMHGVEMKNAYKMVIEGFEGQWHYVLFYAVAMVALCSHLMHGAWSAVQSLGLTRASNIPMIAFAGTALAVVLAAGFVLFPILIGIGLFDASALPDAGGH